MLSSSASVPQDKWHRTCLHHGPICWTVGSIQQWNLNRPFILFCNKLPIGSLCTCLESHITSVPLHRPVLQNIPCWCICFLPLLDCFSPGIRHMTKVRDRHAWERNWFWQSAYKCFRLWGVWRPDVSVGCCLMAQSSDLSVWRQSHNVMLRNLSLRVGQAIRDWAKCFK